ncbi:MAG: alpha/beta hydrolase [Ruminococcus sp.]|nr:alpha/beta hydrolase [Ruminococcus sp.]
MSDIHTGTVKTDEFSMDYLKFGRGERTLVILPGLSVQRVMLSANAVANAYKQLTEDFTVYLFERRNELPGIYSVYDMARDTIKAIEALGLERFSLLGASQGGMIAMVIASEKPMLVEKLILASTSAAVTDKQYEALFDGWIRLAEAGDKQGLYLAFGESIYPDEIFEQSKKLIIQAAKTVTDKDLERFIILARGIKGFDMTERLGSITCPVLVIGSADDKVIEPDAIKAIKTPSCEVYMYEGYGHAVYDTAPDFKERILEFLR